MGTSNFELDEIGDKLIPFYRHCVMKNELKNMKPNEKESLIVNLNNSDEKGSHWLLIYKNGNEKIFFDSFGVLPPKEVIDYLGKNIYTSDIKIQNFDETVCGLYCILIAYLLNCNHKFEDIIIDLLRIEK